MIAKLKGRIEAIGEDHVVIDVGGVGYLVQCSAKTLARLPPMGEAVALEIETKVSEDAIRLFGFLTSDERAWFRLLLDVQGVGAKVGLNILSALDSQALNQAVRSGDKSAFARASGVGPKLAQRLALELKDKTLPVSFGIVSGTGAGASPPAAGPIAKGVAAEALSALTNLGYKPAEAERALDQVFTRLGTDSPIGEIIRQALRELAR
jgi:Holliday junction DNA helicase RuvA